MSNPTTTAEWQLTAAGLDNQVTQLEQGFEQAQQQIINNNDQIRQLRQQLNSLPAGSAERRAVDAQMIQLSGQNDQLVVTQGQITTQLSPLNLSLNNAQRQAALSSTDLPGTDVVPRPGNLELPGNNIVQPTATVSSLSNTNVLPAPNPDAGYVSDSDAAAQIAKANAEALGTSYVSDSDAQAQVRAETINNPLYGLTPGQIEQLGGADPTDPYIRARLGIPQLPGSTLDATPGFGTIKTGVPIVDSALGFLGSLFGGKPTTPAATQSGTTTGVAIPSPDTAAVAQEAARTLVQNPTLTAAETINLVNIDQAQAEIGIAEENIQANNRSILANEEAQAGAQEQQRQAQAIIDQNNAELADKNLPNDRRLELEANNAAQRASIAENAAVIDEAQNNIDSSTANSQQQQASITENQTAVAENSAAFAVNGNALPGNVPFTDEEIRARLANAEDAAAVEALTAEPVPPGTATGYVSDADAAAQAAQASTALGAGYTSDSDAAAQIANVQKKNAQSQSTLQARKNTPSSADWRVRLQLARGANYLYKAGNAGSEAGILKPLYDTDGVVFPYTPIIDTSYQAKYDSYDLVHSNYRGYFYKGSSVDTISVKGTFTAQDTREAQYLLAVIHFFRSVTKMFYGQDAQAGVPPPLVYLSGLGQYQFNEHPCVVSTFNYNLPNDVDYIRANGFNNYGINLDNRRNLSSGPAPNGSLGVLNRLLTNGLAGGSTAKKPPPDPLNNSVKNQSATNSTYVPTKMEISITLFPIQTRAQVSSEFSLKGFANGDLLKRGFW